MLKVQGVEHYYGASHTLWDINIEIPKGGCVCLMGRNGVGKTTLLKTIMGILPAKSGEIYFNGTLLSNHKAEQRAALGIGYVPQGREIFPLLTVEENLKIGRRVARKQGITAVPEFIYELFPVLKEMLKRRGGDLSGGQQQQLAIARALVINPSLLILDEPTEGIQPNIVSEIGEVIIRLNRSRGTPLQLPKTNAYAMGEIHQAINQLTHDFGITVLLVEQKLPFAQKLADYFCLMERGRIVATGAMESLDETMINQYLTV